MIFYQKNEFAYCKYTNGYGVCINYSYLLLNRLSAQSLSWPKHDIQITLQEKSIILFKSKWRVVFFYTQPLLISKFNFVANNDADIYYITYCIPNVDMGQYIVTEKINNNNIHF